MDTNPHGGMLRSRKENDGNDNKNKIREMTRPVYGKLNSTMVMLLKIYMMIKMLTIVMLKSKPK